MDKNITDNTKEYYQACRDQYASQEALNREFSIKTLGILTFCATVFGVAISLLEGKSEGYALTSLWFVGGALVLAVSLGLWILLPRKHKCQFDISAVRDRLGKEHGDFMLMISDAYERAIQHNWAILRKNGRKMIGLTVVAAIELVAFIYLQISLLLC